MEEINKITCPNCGGKNIHIDGYALCKISNEKDKKNFDEKVIDSGNPRFCCEDCKKIFGDPKLIIRLKEK